jgi:hypothetical protein
MIFDSVSWFLEPYALFPQRFVLKFFQIGLMNHRYGKISTLGKGSCKDKKIRTQIRLCLGKGFCICKGKKKFKTGLAWGRDRCCINQTWESLQPTWNNEKFTKIMSWRSKKMLTCETFPALSLLTGLFVFCLVVCKLGRVLLWT